METKVEKYLLEGNRLLTTEMAPGTKAQICVTNRATLFIAWVMVHGGPFAPPRRIKNMRVGIESRILVCVGDGVCRVRALGDHLTRIAYRDVGPRRVAPEDGPWEAEAERLTQAVADDGKFRFPFLEREAGEGGLCRPWAEAGAG